MKLRIGVVGSGRIATESHLPALKNIDNVEVAAICDQQVALADEAARRFGVKITFDDLGKMLSKEKIDIVDICTPPYTHAPLSIRAMEAGCHVLVEKPLATSVQEADEMIDSMKQNNVRLCVIHQNLCNPAVVKARRMVESGMVGELLDVSLHTLESKNSEMCLNPNHWCYKLPGGIFYEILPHPVYLLQSFLKDAEVFSVASAKLGDAKWMTKDEVRVSLKAENGLGSIISSCNSLVNGDWLEILGTKMGLKVDLWGRTLIANNPRMKSSAFSVGKSNVQLSMQLFKILGSTGSTMIKALRGPIKVSAHYNFISESIKSIQNNTKPVVTAEDGRQTVKILEKICKQI